MSAAQDAIRALAKAGRSDEVAELLDKAAKRAAVDYAEIRKDRTRSADGLRWLLAQAYVQHRRSVDKRLADMAATVVRRDREDAEAVFGVKGLPGDAASLIISRRDAADRVAAVERREDLRDLLARATRSGDEVLARAVAERAVEMHDSTTMNLFLADRPHLETAGERLWNAECAADDTFATTVRLGGIRPAELTGMAAGAIEQLAESQPAGATA